MRRAYVETSVWGMVPPGQNPALRQPTLEFLSQCERRVFLPCISDVVANEMRQAPPGVQEPILQRLSEVNPVLLPLPPEVDLLAQRFIDEGILPARRLDDARHVACALVNEVVLLVSWNYRHLANVRKAEGFNAVAILTGIRSVLEIHTPFEVLEWE
jgi:hypothetical protein